MNTTMQGIRLAGTGLTLVLSAGLAGDAVMYAPTIGEACPPNRGFEGTFIQPELVDDWSDAELETSQTILDEACIGTQLLQFTLVSGPGANSAVFDTSARLPDYPRVTRTDTVDRLLEAASRHGRNVYLGLQLSSEWFIAGVHTPEWFDREADLASEIAASLVAQYGHYSAFAGWYLPFEVDNVLFTDEASWNGLGTFYSEVTGRLKELTPSWPVAISPFFNRHVADALQPQAWTDMWQTILPRSGIDILALQDGGGSGENDVVDLRTWFEATRAGIQASGSATRLFANTETFRPDRSASVSEFLNAREIAAPFVDAFWAFAYDHYQSPVAGHSSTTHATYLDFLRTGTVDSTPPHRPNAPTVDEFTRYAVTLVWTRLSDNIGVHHIDVLRDGATIGRIDGAARTFRDEHADLAAGHSYRLVAVDAAGNRSIASDPSDTEAGPRFEDEELLSRHSPYRIDITADPAYPDQGDTELTDGRIDPLGWGPEWQGRSGSRYSITIDLRSIRRTTVVAAHFFQARLAEIRLPRNVAVSISTDGSTFTRVGSIGPPFANRADQTVWFRLDVGTVSARYIRLAVDGTPAWSFIDEVEVFG